MNDLVTGGNVDTYAVGHRPFRQRHPKLHQLIFITGSLTLGSVIGLVGMPLLLSGSLSQEHLDVAVGTTSINIDHALARGTSLNTILAKPATYADSSFRDAAITITRGSCGTTTRNAYTITATNSHGDITLFTASTENTTHGPAAKKAALLAQACAK